MSVGNKSDVCRLPPKMLSVSGLWVASVLLTGCAGAKDDAAQLLTPNLVAAAKQAASTTPAETGSLSGKPVSVALPAAQLAALAVQTPVKDDATATSSNPELYIDFQSDSVTLSDKEKASLREAVAARALTGWSRISISAARGGAGNQFDQAIVGQKRARAVNEIIPIAMIELVEFDPTLPEDTVRLEFKRPPPAKS
jgi:hypothetical protein